MACCNTGGFEDFAVGFLRYVQLLAFPALIAIVS
jgi:hypothetical protein